MVGGQQIHPVQPKVRATPGTSQGGARIIPRTQSEGDQGSLIEVTGTTTGTSVTLFTATAQTGSGVWDLVTIEACNNHTADVVLTVEVIDATHPPKITIPFSSGFFTVLEDHPLRDGNTIKAFAGTASVVFVAVKAHRVTGGVEG